MHHALRLQFDRIANEFGLWRAVADEKRSPAPAWWWGPAMDALDAGEAMSPELCTSFELPPGSPYGSGADVLMKALAEQTSLAWPDEFPEKFRQSDTA